ncbi:MAG: ShlB/FhaC/HecB family hemolysin secretion/activation protein [Candidatus Omnitrophota bacterium]
MCNVRAENPPSGQDIGAQSERLKQDIEEKEKQLKEKKARPPEIEIQEEKKVKSSVLEASFVLRGIKLSGTTVFGSEDFLNIYQPYLNQKVTFAELQSVVEKIKIRYKEKSYLTTTAYIPEQNIQDGVIEIVVAEGKMGKLTIEGNRYFSNSFLANYFHSKNNEVLNIRKVSRDILRLNQNSDIEVKTIISAGEAPQTSDVTLKIKERFPWHVGAAIDNQGGRFTGKWRTSYSLRSSNASGRGDSLFLNTLSTSRSLGQFLNYSRPLDTYGTKIGLSAAFFKMKVGKEFKTFDIAGVTEIFTPYFIKELYLAENAQVGFDAGLEIKSVKKWVGDSRTSNDQLRIPYFSFDCNRVDYWGRTSFSPRFSFGTDHFLGASSPNHPSASRDNTGGFFFKYEQSLSRVQRMFLDSYISLRTQAQVASHTLPSSEQFQLGGASSVRGYPEGDYLGDMGWNANFEWIFPMYLIPEKWKLAGQNIPLRRQIEPVIFFDAGSGKLIEPTGTEVPDKALYSVGGGLRMRFIKNSYLRLDWAKHIGDEPVSGVGASTFHCTFQMEL